MTFEDVWREAKGLPDAAFMQVPSILSKKTKKTLSRRTPDEVARIVLVAVDEINHGSVTSLDELIKRQL